MALPVKCMGGRSVWGGRKWYERWLCFTHASPRELHRLCMHACVLSAERLYDVC